tara:strand:+ start:377 stop:592 length:216 start_codon:yes stop_codon:yes gene_type:complete
MKRLFKSYKFYAAVFGTSAAFVGAGVFDLDTSVITMVLGLWTSLIAGQAVKDYQIEKNRVGGELPPDDDEG